MANTFVVNDLVARTSLAALWGNLVFGRLVMRDANTGFGGGDGSTVRIRKQAKLALAAYLARPAGTVTPEDLTESEVTVQLGLLAKDVSVYNEQLTLDIENMRFQVLDPVATAVAHKIEFDLGALAADGSIAFIDPAGGALDALAQASTEMNDIGVEPERFCVVGKTLAATLLSSSTVVDQSVRGAQAVDALTNARIGRAYGFDIYQSPYVADGEGVCFSRYAYALTTRTTESSPGAASQRVVNENGIALRTTYAYDMATRSDRIGMDVLSSTDLIDAERAIRLAAL